MGNSTSNAQRTGRPTDPRHVGRGRSPSPSPHSALRNKKRSLELPDIHLGPLTPVQPRPQSHISPPKSAAIAIPNAANPDAPEPRRPLNNFSSSELIVPATHLPFPPPSRNQHSSASHVHHRSRGPQPMQSIYDHSRRSSSPPSPSSFKKEIVQSSIPIGLDIEKSWEDDGEAAPPAPPEDPAMLEPIPFKITWRGGGKNVILARAGDHEWSGRQVMERETPLSNTWFAIIYILPGTHHIRFLVDDQWRVSDELPTAVDDQGSLANYVNVQPNSPPTQSLPLPPPATPQKLHQPGQSFWSAASTDDGGEEYRPPNERNLHAQVTQAKWTNVLPQELIEAAREEEAYISASAGQYDANTRGTHVVGFVPAPNIPPAPNMPRHLDKLILNTKVTVPSQHGSGNSSTGSPSRGSSSLPAGVGSGQGGTGSRERGKREGRERRRREDREYRERRREEKERDKENKEEREKRDRDREKREEREKRTQQQQQQQQQPPANFGEQSYANLPPAPPPSEDGSGAGLDDKPEHSPVRGERTSVMAQKPIESASVSEGGITPTPPQTMPTTLPTNLNPNPSSSSTSPQSQTPATSIMSITSVTSTASAATTSITTPQRPGSSPLSNTEPTAKGSVSGSRAITLDMENMPALTDDASVLPVPSHVVLQHLCTSAIRNGVLAVATTTRYRKKCMTTVYYKPTSTS